jgi:hypothetical protein
MIINTIELYNDNNQEEYKRKTNREMSKRILKQILIHLFHTIGYTKSVKQINQMYFQVLKNFLLHHPEAEPRNLSQIDDIEIYKLNNNDSSFHILVHFPCGAKDTISWNRCITRKMDSVKDKCFAAMRFAVRDQILDFKRKHPNPQCELCGIVNHTVFEVDHVIHFHKIADDFLSWKDYTPSEYSKHHCFTAFTPHDQQFEQEWKEYHQQHSQLRWLCQKCNNKRGSKFK